MQRDIQTEHEAAERATLRGQKREVAVQAVRAAAAVYNAAVDAAESLGIRVRSDWCNANARTGHFHITPRFLVDFDEPEPGETWIQSPPRCQPSRRIEAEVNAYTESLFPPLRLFKGW